MAQSPKLFLKRDMFIKVYSTKQNDKEKIYLKYYQITAKLAGKNWLT